MSSSSATVWLITIGWTDASMVDFLVRSSSKVRTRLEIYHWFFSHIHDIILRFDYSPLDHLEGDLDLGPLLNREIEHENLNINSFEDFLTLNLEDIDQYMRENGQAHGMVITVVEAQKQNYQIITPSNDKQEVSVTKIWKVTYNPRPLTCLSPRQFINLYDLLCQMRSKSIWKIRAREEHQVYQYILQHLSQFNSDDLPLRMNKTLEQLIAMVQRPLEVTHHQFISEMINIQSCPMEGHVDHQHSIHDSYRYCILVEPSLDLFDIIDI